MHHARLLVVPKRGMSEFLLPPGRARLSFTSTAASVFRSQLLCLSSYAHVLRG